MSTVATLTIEMAANVARIQKDMQKVRGTVDGAMSQVKKSVQLAATALGAIGGALSVQALATMAKNFANLSSDIERFSTLAGVSAERFQEIAFATNTVGISQEKLSDILKDVQDRVGDFLQTGGGPMADFFENIAPKVDVTADQFAKLGGQEALQLYVSSLEKANLTQPEMIFFLEAMASDSSLLLPLLKDNGKELEVLTGRARDLGVVIKDETLEASKDFKKNLDELSATFTGIGITVANAVIPELNSLTKTMKDLWPVFQPFLEGGSIIVGFAAMRLGVLALASAITTRLLPAVLLLGAKFAVITAAAATLAYFINVGPQLKTDQEQLNVALAREAELREKIAKEGRDFVGFTGGKTLGQQLDEQVKLVENTRKRIQDALKLPETGQPETDGGSVVTGGTLSQSEIEARKKAAEAAAKAIAKAEADAIKEQQREAESEYKALIDRLTSENEEVAREGAAIFQATRTPIELLNMEFAKLDELLETGAIDWETYSRAVFQASDSINEVTASNVDQFETLRQAVDGAAKDMAQAFTDFAISGKGDFGDLVDSILADIARLVIQQKVTDPLVKAIGGIDFGELIGGFFGSANGNIMTKSGPVPLVPHARGGIANKPMLSLFGEGSTPEAYVPLPDGRTIPVTMTGGGMGDVNVEVNVINQGQPANARVVGQRQTGNGLSIDVLIDTVDNALGARMSKGQGSLANAVPRKFGLNGAAGNAR